MTINKAFDRVKWRIKNGWKPNENDIEAINTIGKFISDKHKQQFNFHTLYSKLYITYYGELLRYYKTTVMDDIPQKELHRILERPLDQIISDFIDVATEVEQSLQYEVDGILNHPLQLSKDKKESISIIQPVMDFEEAKQNLYKTINLSIDRYS